MSVAIAPMASRARLDHHVISRAHRTARVRSHYLSPPSPVIPRGALPAAKGPRKVPALPRAADARDAPRRGPQRRRVRMDRYRGNVRG